MPLNRKAAPFTRFGKMPVRVVASAQSRVIRFNRCTAISAVCCHVALGCKRRGVFSVRVWALI